MDTIDFFRSGLTKQQTRATLGLFNWNLALRGVFDATCAGTTIIFVSYALALGIPAEKMGFVTTAVSAACILQILSISVSRRVPNKKRLVVVLSLIEPLLMIAAVLVVPFLPAVLRLYVLSIAAFVAAAALHLSRPLTEEWVASAIPAGLRGRYLGRRIQVLSIVIIVTTLLSTFLAQRLDKTRPVLLGMVLAVGGIFGLLAALPLRRATMPAVTASNRVRSSDLLRVWRHREYSRYVLGVLAYNAPFLLAVPYYQVFNLKVLGLPEGAVGLIAAGYFLCKILATFVWAPIVKRLSPRRILFMLSPAYVLFFCLFPLSSVMGTWAIVFAWLLIGCCDAAYLVAAGAALYEAIPTSAGRPAFFVVYNLVLLGASGICALISVPLLGALKNAHLQIGPMNLGQFHIFYLLIAGMMLPALFGSALLAGKRAITQPASPQSTTAEPADQPCAA